MPLVRSDGLPTQHMRALAYWAAAPELDDVDLAAGLRHRVGRPRHLPPQADRRAGAQNGNGNGSASAAARRPTTSSTAWSPASSEIDQLLARKGALLIDDLVEWIDERARRRPRAAPRCARPPAPRTDAGAGRARLLPPAADDQAGRVRAGEAARRGEGEPRLGPGAGAGPPRRRRGAQRRRARADPDYRFAVVQSELYRRHLRQRGRATSTSRRSPTTSRTSRAGTASDERAPRGRARSSRRCSTQGARGLGTGGGLMRTLLVDNHDSYTYNVFHLLAAASGEEPIVVNNDAVSWRVLSRSDFDAIVLSPGPGPPRALARLRRLPRHPPLQRDPGARHLPRPPGDRQPARGRRRQRADGDARPAQPRQPRRHAGSSRASRRTSRWSATTRWRSPARRPGRPRHRLDRRRRRDGHRTHAAADVGRPVPPRVDC